MADSKETGSGNGWSWRVGSPQQNADLGLLYEPGNWGDILKGTWAGLIASQLPAGKDGRPLVYLDPWCGAPEYPLLEGPARRLEWLGSCSFIDLQRHWLEQGKVASTGLLVREVLRTRGLEVQLNVFDTDPGRLEKWAGVEGAEMLSISSGEQALQETAADLVLADPYDYLADWEKTLPLLAGLAGSAVVLVYLYNRSPRGGEHTRKYNRFRQELDKLDCGYLTGRIGSDILLPRAFHEMLLLAPASFISSAESELGKATRQLACKMSTAGCFEKGGPGTLPDYPGE